MARVYFIKSAATILLKINQDTLESNLAASPHIVGEELARQINDYVKQENLGYYPAMDYFLGNPAIDQDLIDTAQGIAWVVAELVRSEIRSRLRAAFSHVEIEDLQSLAFTMPGIRLNRANALRELARHYTPNIEKVTLIVSSIERRPDIAGLDRLVGHKIVRWLSPHFDEVKVTSVRIIRD